MTDPYILRLLYAAESLGYIFAGWAWWRVWLKPIRPRFELAAVATAAGFAIKFARLSLVIVLNAP